MSTLLEGAVYVAEATATHEGRNGSVASSDGRLSVDLSVPVETGGPGGDGTNPEQLFAAGWAACFTSALNLTARRRRIAVEQLRVTAHVGLVRADDQWSLSARLVVALPELGRDVAEELAAAAHEVCPYSKAVKGNIPVSVTVA